MEGGSQRTEEYLDMGFIGRLNPGASPEAIKPDTYPANFAPVARTGRIYLELRRARKRARAEATNAPAEPTRARTTVGFSGEFTQPPCAFAETVTATIHPMPVRRSAYFFMIILSWKYRPDFFACQFPEVLSFQAPDQ
jgi:hypothetical protein